MKKIKFISFILIIVVITLTKIIPINNEVITITTELAKKKSPIVLEKEEVIKEVIVYDNMTIDQLAEKLNKSMYGTLKGKGLTFANYSIQYSVDPYLALAIVLHETGCKWNCSYLVTNCNNIGGQKGYPNCGNSSYGYFSSLDDGIKAFFENLSNNYYKRGLKDIYSIHKKYAEDPNWPIYINNYINEIKIK